MNGHRPILVALLLLSGLMSGCGPSATAGGFDSPNPAAKMYAIEQAVKNGDHGAIRHLIEQLDSSDPGVRFMAIEALHRLTGRTYGYDYSDSRQEREQAIGRWQQAYETGELERSIPGTPEKEDGEIAA